MSTNMTFVDFTTPVPADWLNNVNAIVNFSVVSSIAALKTVAKTLNTYVFVENYAVTNDKGGGWFILNPNDTVSADNGGTIIVGNDGGRWYRTQSTNFTVRQFGARGDGVTDDTTAIQNAINAVVSSLGGTLEFPQGTYLCGSLTCNVSAGGTLYSPGGAQLLPNGNNVTFFTLTNSLNLHPFTIDGIQFNNNALKTNVSGVVGSNLYQFALKNTVIYSMGYVLNLTSTIAGGQAFNASVTNVTQFGSGSFSFAGTTTARYFDVHIDNVTQFTTGGDTWVAPWFTFTRVITALLTNVHGQSLSGNAIGVHVVGQCEGIFLANCVIPFSASGIVADNSNGDAVLPSWIYIANCGVDQFTTHGMDINANYFRITNTNITGGATRQNTGSGLLIRGTCIDYTCEGLQIQGMWNDGLTVLTGASQGHFLGCNFNQNGQSGSGNDVDIVALTPRDPLFTNCTRITQNVNSSMVINGGSTSRYVNSQRTQVLSNGTSNQVLATYTLPAGSFIDGKTVRIVASGISAANGNTKTMSLNIGGVQVLTQTGAFNNTAWVMEGEVYRIDSNNVWLTGKAFSGITSGVTSSLQNPFNSSVALVVSLTVTTTASSDIAMHHFDVEIID